VWIIKRPRLRGRARLECHYDHSTHNSLSLPRHRQEVYCPILRTLRRLQTASSERKPITMPDVVSDSTFDFADFDISPKTPTLPGLSPALFRLETRRFAPEYPISYSHISCAILNVLCPRSFILPMCLTLDTNSMSSPSNFPLLNTTVWYQAFLLFKFCPS
jgi:hypothetical protein